jgi:hypothetical protein
MTQQHVSDSGRCAIFTKYLGPTNYRGGRIKAWAKSGGKLSVTISYPHELSQSQAHAAAAVALLDKMGWTCGILHQAHAENGCVFVMDR